MTVPLAGWSSKAPASAEKRAQQVRAGEALGPVMSQYTGIDQIGRKEGAIGVFTGGKLTRSSVYHQAVVLALSPFHNAIYR